MRVRGDNAPSNAFALEEQPKRPGFVLVRLYEDVRPFVDGDLTGYEYDEYHLEMPDRPGIEVDIASQFEIYLSEAKLREVERLTIPDLHAQIGRLEELMHGHDGMPEDLEGLKGYRITETKTALGTYLAEHPLLWSDGKYYSVTAEKQALLNNAIAVYQIGVQAGQTPELTWNATTEECTEWEFADLCALALAIAAYVKPLVAHQQALEVMIRAAGTAEEVQAIEITYD